jgi:predicted small metal-binding protein
MTGPRVRNQPINRYRIMSQVVLKMPSFKCIAKNCPFEASAPTEAELMKKIVEHAKTVHNMDPMPPDILAKVKAAIKP